MRVGSAKYKPWVRYTKELPTKRFSVGFDDGCWPYFWCQAAVLVVLTIIMSSWRCLKKIEEEVRELFVDDDVDQVKSDPSLERGPIVTPRPTSRFSKGGMMQKQLTTALTDVCRHPFLKKISESSTTVRRFHKIVNSKQLGFMTTKRTA
jgi:hypothetical protein